MKERPGRLGEVIRDFRRDQVIAGARRVFGERGTVEVSIADIAAAAGVSRSTVYNYFSTRDDVLQACLARGHEQLVEAMNAALDSDSGGRDQLRAYLEVVIRHVDESPAFFRVAIAMRPSSSELDVMSLELGAMLHRVVERGTEEGTLRASDVSAALQLIGYLLFGALYARTASSTPPAPPAAEAAEELVGFILDGLGAGSRRSPGRREANVSDAALVIRGGDIVDGSGTPRWRADVGIEGDRRPP